MTPLARRALGPLYPALMQLKTSEFARAALASLGHRAYLRRSAANGETFGVDIAVRMGMGALIAQALLCHAHAEREGLQPAIVSSNPLYARKPGDDLLARYFDRPAAASGLRLLDGRSYEWAYRNVIPSFVTLDDAARLFARWFVPAAPVCEQVAAALAGRTAFDLSVHFRGTDKVLESGTVAHEALFDELDGAIDALERAADVFLATDDAAFEAAIRARYPSSTFSTYNLGQAENNVARHFSAMSPDDKAMEAIVNIFLIATTPLCLRTSSYLSAISRVVNPTLVTRTVNRTLEGSTLFPERQVLSTEAAA